MAEQEKYGLPAFLSLLIPGFGQLIKGEVVRGIVIFFVTLVGLAAFVIPGIIIWIWQIKDAYDSPKIVHSSKA